MLAQLKINQYLISQMFFFSFLFFLSATHTCIFHYPALNCNFVAKINYLAGWVQSQS